MRSAPLDGAFRLIVIPCVTENKQKSFQPWKKMTNHWRERDFLYTFATHYD